MEFMNDNAFILTAGIIKNWFDEDEIPLVNWLPYPPNLNPIEHAWAKLKERIYMLYSEIESFDSTKEQLEKQLYKTIKKA